LSEFLFYFVIVLSYKLRLGIRTERGGCCLVYPHMVIRLFSLLFILALLNPAMLVRAESTEDFEWTNPEDPWEGFNRKIFFFNDGVDRYLLLPVASAYRFIMPRPLDQGVTNFFRNLLMPISVANSVFQLKFQGAGVNLGRFLVNSTAGVLGFIDVASRVGLEERPEDFGQTLGYWGVKPGPYLVVPFWGGVTIRDGVGLIPDWQLSLQSSINDLVVRNSLLVVQVIDKRADLIPAEQLITGDRYIFLRDAYLQQRKYLVADGVVEDDFGDDGFGDDDFGSDFLDDFDDDSF
jgi:phospholipid-binding lipoprotein MlaA